MTTQRPWVGAVWKLVAFTCYAALNSLARYLSGGAGVESTSPIPVSMIIFFQDLFALLVVSPWLIKQCRSMQKPRFIGLHLFRVIVSAVAVIAWYFALFFLPQADAVALSVVGPMLGVIGAHWYLKEKLSGLRLFMISLTFFGACYFVQPFSALSSQQNDLYGLSFVLISAVAFALAKIATRKLASLGESRQLLTAYLLVLIVPVTFIPALFVWQWPQAIDQWLWLIFAGVLTAAALYSVSSALAYAEVSFLAPFDLFRFVINAAVGYLAFMELPAAWALWIVIAGVLMTASTLHMRWRSS